MREFLLGFVVGILTLPAGAFAAAWMGWLPTNANATPTPLEQVSRIWRSIGRPPAAHRILRIPLRQQKRT